VKAPGQYLFGRANEADILPLVASTPLQNPLMAVVRYCPIADLDIQINFHFIFLTPLFSDAL